MADENNAPVMPGKEVFSFTFCAAMMSYIATSYPHPTRSASPDDTRDITFTPNLPISFTDRVLKTLIQVEHESSTGNRYCTLKRGYYLMNSLIWSPEGVDWNHTTAGDPNFALWFAYIWTGHRAGSKIHPHPFSSVLHDGSAQHPDLLPFLQDLLHSESHIDGSLSYFSIGESYPRADDFHSGQAERFFMRLTDTEEKWHYSYDGLPGDCKRAFLRRQGASKPDKNDGSSKMLHKRPRAITFGRGGGWILWGQDWHEYGGHHLPEELVYALDHGQKCNWTINQAVLNPKHHKEYVLVFNEGHAYYSLHDSFKEDFDRTAAQWAHYKRVTYVPHSVLLHNVDYPPPAIPREYVRRSSTRQWGATHQSGAPVYYTNMYSNPSMAPQHHLNGGNTHGQYQYGHGTGVPYPPPPFVEVYDHPPRMPEVPGSFPQARLSHASMGSMQGPPKAPTPTAPDEDRHRPGWLSGLFDRAWRRTQSEKDKSGDGKRSS